jgi:polyketide synthase 12
LDTAALDGAYWYRNLRERVRFDDAVRVLIADGASAFVEISPHPGLTLAIEAGAAAAGASDRVVAVGSLRRGEGGLQRFVNSLAEAHVHGVEVDWAAIYADLGGHRIQLPTYAFQRERYWLERGRDAGDLAAAGLTNVDHPLLSAMLTSPTDRGCVFTGRLSLADLPWLADHAVFGRVLFPATAFVELVLAGGGIQGCGVVEELTLEAPLVVAEDEEVALQVVVGEEDDRGRREVRVYSRRVADSDAEWTHHASGVVVGDRDAAHDALPQSGGGIWPPVGAEQVDVTALYDRLADAGFDYGPLFRGTAAAWRRGDEMFCEVTLGEPLALDAARFGLHPALLDASFHATIDGLSARSDGRTVPLPFSLAGVRLYRTGASSLRVRVSTLDDGRAVSLSAVDHCGRPVLELESLVMRAVDGDRLGRIERGGEESLFRHEWVEVALDNPAAESMRCAVLGASDLAAEAPRYSDLDELLKAIEAGADAPDVVIAAFDARNCDAGIAEAARDGVVSLLAMLQAWLASDAYRDSRLVVVTRGAMSVTQSDVPDPAGAALWGLARSAQSEHPGRFVLIDLEDASAIDWPALVATGEPQLAVRRGTAHALRVARLHGGDALAFPTVDGAWHLDTPSRGTVEALTLVESSRALNPLGPEEVRIAVRAAGLNFRDVLIALGEYPDDDPIGSEGAGVVLEVGDAVTGLAVGDRVMGLMPEAVGPVAVTDRRLVSRVPAHWSYAEGASVPIVFMTAYYGLVELAALRAGQTVLVHAGAGGVGMAAIQIARHLGAEVYATASPEKWHVLRALGLDDDHIASSRDLEFRDRFLAATGGKGVDVVLNALARQFVDASLELLPRGGRFIEMGKSDIRDAGQIRLAQPGVEYRAYDLMRDAGPDRVAEMLLDILTLFEAGALRHLPLRAWDVRHAVKAFRHLGDGRNVGKVVLTIPRALDPAGTVLITGGTGDLGARVARHLATELGVRDLLLVSRRGPDSPGAPELIEELRELGADPSVVACDVTNRDETAALLATIDAERPLTAVIHTAGVLDDGVIDSLSTEQVDRVLRPKVNAALVLHELTRGSDLAEFVLFSSDSGTVGVPGQGNYAAANVCLDALADLRRAQGMPGKSLAWGLWSNPRGMAGDLSEADIARLARLGVATLSGELELFDIARAAPESVVVPTRLNMEALRAALEAGTLPPLMRDVVRGRRRRGPDVVRSLEQQLAGVPEPDRERAVLDVVCAQIAVVLGHSSSQSLDPERKFKELGFDSLSAVELRNRLAQVSGLRLPSTLIFDHPSPVATTRYLLDRLSPASASDGASGDVDIRRLLASISIEQLRTADLLDPLLRLAGSDVFESDPARSNNGHANGSGRGDQSAAVEHLDLEELVRMARRAA